MAILTSLRRTTTALVCALALAVAVPVLAQAGLEYEVKAAFLYNFIKFVEWPSETIPAGEPFRVCLLGDDPFKGLLERTVRGDTVDGHPIAVERLALDGSAEGCQMLFVPRAHTTRGAAAARALGTGAVLIVGESAEFLAAGGVINLVVDEGHVRFDVSLTQAAARGLRISSKLLRVARNTGAPDRQDR